jgi:maleate isomerase
VKEYFSEQGFDVVKQNDLKFRDALDIPRSDDVQLARELIALDSPLVDAILQVGANLDTTRVGDAIEYVVDNPVLGFNAVVLWDAMRLNKIDTRIDLVGRLFREL